MLFVLGVIGLLSTLAMPALSRARGSAQASSAIATLKMINSAQLSFAIGCGLGFYAPDLPALGMKPPMSTDGFIPADMATAATVLKSGYSFTVSGAPLATAPSSCNGLAVGQTSPGYTVVADTLDPTLAPRYFATNADGLIYEHTATMSGVMPDVGPPATGEPVNR